jgi:hypothetical protein
MSADRGQSLTAVQTSDWASFAFSADTMRPSTPSPRLVSSRTRHDITHFSRARGLPPALQALPIHSALQGDGQGGGWQESN